MNSTKYNVISNTTPIIALASIEKLELLPVIFNEITIAKAVSDEINAGGRIKVPSLETIEWIKIRKNLENREEELLSDLDEGEKQTILLGINAASSTRCLLLIDERKGRKIATSKGLRIKGTLGILADAKRRRLINNFKSYAFKLLENNLYYDLKLIETISREVDSP